MTIIWRDDMGKGKRVLALLFLVMVCISVLPAKNAMVHSIGMEALVGRQNVYYKNPKYKNRDSIGFGGGIEYTYRIGDTTWVGAGVSLEEYRFEGFFDYHDLKMTAEVKQRLFSFSDERIDFNVIGGLGADMVFKSDGDRGIYFLASGGVSLELFHSEAGWDESSLSLKFEAQGTFQGGSTVLHLIGSIGLSLPVAGVKGGEE